MLISFHPLPFPSMPFLSGRGQTALPGFILGSALLAEERTTRLHFTTIPCARAGETAPLFIQQSSSLLLPPRGAFQSFWVLSEPILCFSLLDTESWGCPRWFGDERLWICGKPWVSSWHSWVVQYCVGCFAFPISPLFVLLYFYVYKLYIYKINKEVSVENKSLLREGKMTLNWQLYRRYDAFDWLVVKEM